MTGLDRDEVCWVGVVPTVGVEIWATIWKEVELMLDCWAAILRVSVCGGSFFTGDPLVF